MAKVYVIVYEGDIRPIRPATDRAVIDLRELNVEQKQYFRDAHLAYRQNLNYWEFYGLRTKIYDLVPARGEELIKHPLWRALKELWLALGVNQGQMASKVPERFVHIHL